MPVVRVLEHGGIGGRRGWKGCLGDLDSGLVVSAEELGVGEVPVIEEETPAGPAKGPGSGVIRRLGLCG